MKTAFEQLWRFARREDATGLRLVDVIAVILAMIPVIKFSLWMGSGIWLIVVGIPVMFIASVITTVKIPSWKDKE